MSLKPHKKRVLDTRELGDLVVPGIPYPVQVGGNTATEAELRIQVLSPIAPGVNRFIEPGYIAINDDTLQTSDVNWFVGDIFRDANPYVGLWHGVINLHATSPVHVIIDVNGIG